MNLIILIIISVLSQSVYSKQQGYSYDIASYCSPKCVYYTGRSPSYGLTHEQALYAAQTEMNIQVFFTVLTPSYQLSYHQALEAAQTEMNIQVFFTVLTPSYQLSYHQALEAAQANINVQTYLHLLAIGNSHKTALQKATM